MLNIITEKILLRGAKARKIISFEGCLKNDKLPQKYLDYYPRLETTYSSNHQCIQWNIYFGESYPWYFRKGDIIEEDLFQKILINIRECGNRLHSINERLKKENEGWKGEETIII